MFHLFCFNLLLNHDSSFSQQLPVNYNMCAPEFIYKPLLFGPIGSAVFEPTESFKSKTVEKFPPIGSEGMILKLGLSGIKFSAFLRLY